MRREVLRAYEDVVSCAACGHRHRDRNRNRFRSNSFCSRVGQKATTTPIPTATPMS